MDRSTQIRTLEHQLDLADRAVRLVIDQVTVDRLKAHARDIRRRLADVKAAAAKEATQARAHQLWCEAGCPPGRDLEFWLSAERELTNKARVREPA
jgi:DUF2934 family protein